MKWITIIPQLIKGLAISLGLFLVRKSGRDAEKLDQAENVIKMKERNDDIEERNRRKSNKSILDSLRRNDTRDK
jgi:hypothetical protein